MILSPESNFMAEVDSIKIFGSIASAISELDRDKFNEFYNSVKTGETRISSSFPLIKDTLFFPMPIYQFEYDKDLSEKSEDIKVFAKIKDIKNTRFVSQSVFEEMLNSKPGLGDIFEKIESGEWKLDKRCLYIDEESGVEERNFLIKRYEITKNVLNRYTYGSTIFYSQAYFYNCDLFFLVKTSRDILKLIKTAIKLLEDRGMSQDFSIGFGKVMLRDIKEIELNEPCSGGMTLLSKYHPAEDEMRLIKSCDKYYQIKEIKGFTKNGFHIPPYIFFEEGSYFKLNKVKGKLIDIADTRTSLNGIAYYIKSR